MSGATITRESTINEVRLIQEGLKAHEKALKEKAKSSGKPVKYTPWSEHFEATWNFTKAFLTEELFNQMNQTGQELRGVTGLHGVTVCRLNKTKAGEIRSAIRLTPVDPEKSNKTFLQINTSDTSYINALGLVTYIKLSQAIFEKIRLAIEGSEKRSLKTTPWKGLTNALKRVEVGNLSFPDAYIKYYETTRSFLESTENVGRISSLLNEIPATYEDALASLPNENRARPPKRQRTTDAAELLLFFSAHAGARVPDTGAHAGAGAGAGVGADNLGLG